LQGWGQVVDDGEMDSPSPAHPKRSSFAALAVCIVLLIIFTWVAWRAARTKSPTYDEPYHALSGWLNLRYFDYRIDCEDPPLWKYWAALPNGKSALSPDFSADSWVHQPVDMQLQWIWTVQTLYHTPANKSSDQFVQRSRAMMLVFGPLLGGLIGWWAWRVGGAVAAIVATALFSFDPNFLAHAPLMKNDIVFSLAMFALVFNLWQAGQRLTWLRAIFISLLCGVMLTVKFSGPLAAVLIPALLGIRAILPISWHAFGRDRTTRLTRLGIAAGVTFLAAVVGFVSIWGAYGFRFAPTPDPAIRLNTHQLAQVAAQKEAGLRSGDRSTPPTTDPAAAANEFANAVPSLFVRTLREIGKHHLLPQAWVAGLLFTYQSALIRAAYMYGELSMTGWRQYFPFAMLVKTPVATLAAGGLTILMILRLRPKRWTTICLGLPFLIYFQSAMMSNLNIGVRHVFPLYPFIFVTIGWAAAMAWRSWPAASGITVFVLLTALGAESLSVFPNYIPFFNIAAGGPTAGFHLLGDSNLDWGQDLKLLAAWQHSHPTTRLYLCYFGTPDPAYYGVHYWPLPITEGPNTAWPDGPSTIAVSATYLQGLYVESDLFKTFYQPLSHREPTKILGGTIYLYDYSHAADLIPVRSR
jgi:hypothetical protein